MKKYRDLLHRFLPLVLVIALTIGWSEVFYQNRIHAATERCWEELTMAHSDAAREISNRLNNNIRMLDLAADAIKLNADFEDEETVLAYLNSAQHEMVFDRIDVIFPNGTVLSQATGERIEDRGEKSFAELVSKGSHLTQRVTDFLTGKQVIRALSPVKGADDETIAILSATVYCSTLADIFASAHYGENAQLFLVDMRNGDIVLDKRHEVPGSVYDMRNFVLPDEYKDVNFIADIMAGRSGKMAYTSQSYGQKAYTIYAAVPNTDFSLVMVVQENVLFADVNELKDALLQVGFVEVIVLMIFSLWIYLVSRRSAKNASRAQQAEVALLHQKEQELESQ